MKHNKKRNTAFIYEALVKELTKAIVDKDAKRKNKVIVILKEFFVNGRPLAQELEFYSTLLDTRNVQISVAERLLSETKEAYKRLDENTLFGEQSSLIAAINKGLGSGVWSNFIPNFKSLASINSIFNSNTSVKKRVLFEQDIVDRMSAKQEIMKSNDMKPLDSLTYSSFIKKFNGKFGGLLQEQKELLNHFIASFADDGFELRLYLNEEISRLKSLLNEAVEAGLEPLISQKVDGVVKYLDDFRKHELTEGDLSKILKTQELAQELSAHDHN